MSHVSDAPYLYLYVQSYRLASQDGQSQPTVWKEHFYAPDDDEARKLGQAILAMKNDRATTPYVETSLERSPQDAHVDYYLLAAIKERQPDGTYRAVYQNVQETRMDTHVWL